MTAGTNGGSNAATTDGVAGRSSWGCWITIVVPALLTYVPLLLTAPGVVGADTKTYLYLDPGRVLSDAPYVWNTQIGLGTVTHQYIGYLWPMGPFYWLFDALGVPDWVAQRLWIGTVIFAAGLGVRYLARTLGWSARADRTEQWGGILVASLAYMFSPYLLNYSARISVILLPWAALPWLIALTAKSLRRGGWRYPAVFALVVLTVGGINATALILVGIGPLLYLVHGVWIEREATLRQALAVAGRIGMLTLATSLWWMAGLWAEGRFGLPVIRYTETYRTVATVSSAPEVLRGLGYWFFYGGDKLGPWIEPSTTYTVHKPELALSYAIPLVAILAGAVIRWRYRALFLAIVVVGALTAIAAHPWSNPSAVGALFKAFTRSDAGLSLRSTPRAVPLVALGLALFLGAGVSALGRALPRLTIPVTALAAVVLFANLPTLWTGEMVAKNLERPEQIPDYWRQAADALQAQDDGTRVLELPGSDFASYRWGNTVDPVTPGLTGRGYASRELFQYGSAQSAALLDALDHRLHEGTIDPRAIAPIARVMGAGQVVARNDLQYERFRIIRPRQLWDILTHTPGLTHQLDFGPTTPNVAGPEQPMIDEIFLGERRNLVDPPAVSLFGVDGAVAPLHAQSAQGALLMAGDAEGMVDAAGVGLVKPAQASFFSASSANDPAQFDQVLHADADLLVTDTNRKRAERWGTIREQFGYTERVGEVAPYDPTDQRLDVFPGAGDDASTVSVQRGGATVTATRYGNPVTYTADDRPANALDGDPQSAWRVGAIDDPIGERLTIDLAAPVTTDHVQLLQPINLTRNRSITKARLWFDGGDPLDLTLGPDSRTEPGQTVPFASRTFHRLEIEIVATDVPRRPRYDGLSGVGFAEVGIAGVRVDELLRPPVDLLDRAGDASLAHRLSFVLTRLRSNPSEPVRLDEEFRLNRLLTLPTARSFGLAGSARLSDYVPDSLVDALVGLPDAAHGGITVDSSSHLSGALEQRASAALDGDPSTAWTGSFPGVDRQYLRVDQGRVRTVSHLDLQIVADGVHSVPTEITITPDTDPSRAVKVPIPALADGAAKGATVTVPVDFAPVSGQVLVFDVTGVRQVKVKDWYSDFNVPTPVSIAELGVPGLRVPAPPAAFDSGCRTDLLSVDGQPVPVRVTGSTADALARNALELATCGPTGSVALGSGEHVVRSGVGHQLGIDVDQLALSSNRGGSAMAVAALAADPAIPGPNLTVTGHGRVSYDATVEQASAPFWLALDQSWSDGWKATVNGRELPPPQVINGYGNGWLIDPAVYGAGPLKIHTEWTPQRVVWVAIGLSVVGVIACLILIMIGRARRDAHATVNRPDEPIDPTLAIPLIGLSAAAGRTASARLTVVTALVIGGVVALTTPLHGLGVPGLVVGIMAATAIAFRWRRGRGLAALGAVGLLGLAYLYIVVSQFRHHHVSDFLWPERFTLANLPALAAIFLLVVEAARDLLAPDPGPEPGIDPHAGGGGHDAQ
jgi:arabinofuranan 3-O-arabinosyltransferase